MTIGHEHIDKHMISAMDDGKQQKRFGIEKPGKENGVSAARPKADLDQSRACKNT